VVLSRPTGSSDSIDDTTVGMVAARAANRLAGL
jgi:hypothetical protein